MFERGLVQMYDATSIHGLHAYADEGPGISWKALYAATSDFQPFNDDNVFRSVKSYYAECMPIALTNTATGATMNLLKKGSSTTDLVAELAKAGTSSSVYSTLYTAATPEGTPVTCAAAWASISTSLADPNQFTRYNNGLCAKLNFDVTDTAQLTQCYARLDNLLVDYLGRSSGDRNVLAQNAGIAAAMGSAILDEDPDLAVRGEINRAFIGDGINNLIGWRDWGVVFRYGAMGFSLLALPILMLFLFTPSVNRVLSGVFALFTFNALWGVLDVAAFHFVYEHYARALSDLRNYNLGFDMFQMAPAETIKALTTLGSVRFATMSLAGYLSVQIFQLSGSAFTSLASAFGSKLDEATDRGNEVATNPSTRASMAENMFAASGTFGAARQWGAERFGGALATDKQFDIGSAIGRADASKALGAEKSLGPGDLGRVAGGMSIAGTMGQAEGLADVAGGKFTHEDVTKQSAASARTGTAYQAGQRQALTDYLVDKGLSPGQAGLMRGKLDAAVGVNQDAYRLSGIQSLSDMLKSTPRYRDMPEDQRYDHAAQTWAGAQALHEKGRAQSVNDLGLHRAEALTKASMDIDYGTSQGQIDGANSAGISPFRQGQRHGREGTVGTNATYAAYQGDYGRMFDDRVTETQDRMGSNAGLREAAAMSGMSVTALSAQVAQWERIAALGTSDWREAAIGSLIGATGSVRGAANMLSRFEHLGVTSSILASGGQAGTIEAMGAADIIGDQRNRDMLIDALGLAPGDYATLAGMITPGGTLNLSPEQLLAAHARNPELFDQALVDFAEANGGATVAFRFASDGTPVAMNVSSDRSTRVDHGTQLDTAAYAGQATMREALMSPTATSSDYLRGQFLEPMLNSNNWQATPQYGQLREQIGELLSAQGINVTQTGSVGRDRSLTHTGNIGANLGIEASGTNSRSEQGSGQRGQGTRSSGMRTLESSDLLPESGSGSAKGGFDVGYSGQAQSRYQTQNQTSVSVDEQQQYAHEIMEKGLLAAYRERDESKRAEVMRQTITDGIRERIGDNIGHSKEVRDRIVEDVKD
jgi:hypothetical protein